MNSHPLTIVGYKCFSSEHPRASIAAVAGLKALHSNYCLVWRTRTLTRPSDVEEHRARPVCTHSIDDAQVPIDKPVGKRRLFTKEVLPTAMA